MQTQIGNEIEKLPSLTNNAFYVVGMVAEIGGYSSLYLYDTKGACVGALFRKQSGETDQLLASPSLKEWIEKNLGTIKERGV